MKPFEKSVYQGNIFLTFFNWARSIVGEEILRSLIAISLPTLLGYIPSLFQPIQQFLLDLLPPFVSREQLLGSLPIIGIVFSLLALYRVALGRKFKRLKSDLLNAEQNLLTVQKNFESYVASQRAKEEWKFDSKLGYFFQEGSSEVLCPNCYIMGLKSPLKVQENGWLCLVSDCGHFSRNPEYKAPPPVLRKRRDSGPSWLQGF